MLERVGTCRIEGELAAGGMAVIYRAEQESLGRKVAVKALKTAVQEEDGQFALRFEREARTLAQLQHENLIHVYDFYREHGALFIVMELVDGIDLYDLLERAGALPVDVAAIIALQVARALDYLHFVGVLHRDLKPANILLTKSGVVKLGDFGIADDPRHVGDLTATGVGLGTPSYMSPEQVLGERLDARSDQFALGVVLYQMLAGRKPFIEDAERSVVEKIRGEDPTPLLRLRPEVPLGLQRIVERCLRKRRQDRFASPHELVLALERFLAERVAMNYHTRLVEFLATQGLLAEDEASAVLSSLGLRGAPASSSLSSSLSGAARARPGRLALLRELALKQLAVAAAVGGLLAALHLSPLGRPPSPILRADEPGPPGYLSVLAEPWAEVYVDDQLVETTPFAAALRLRPGRRFVELRNPTCRLRRTLDVVPQQHYQLTATLTTQRQRFEGEGE
ncbi:MAG: serine/threonine-protein kinase [Polyangia bacterium]